MRRGAAATSRAVAQQALSAEEIVKAADGLTRMVTTVAKSMAEQSTAATQIAASAVSMRQQAEQSAKALKEQARAMKDMTSAAGNTAKQIKTITMANREHSQAAGTVLQELTELRRITDRNAAGVRQTREGTTDLVRSAQALTAMVDKLPTKPH